MREIHYRPRAKFDMESIAIYLGEVCRNPGAARSIYESIKGAVQDLAAVPTLGRPFMDETLVRRAYRSWLVGSYRVFYSFDDHTLTVWRVIHNRQDIDDFAFIEWKWEEEGESEDG